MAILTPEQREFFFRSGFLVIDPKIPMEIIDGVISDLDGKYPDPLNGAGVQPPTRIQDAWKVSHNARSIAVWPHIMDLLHELYGREALPFQTLNFPVGTLQKPHSDIVHFNSCPPTFMCGVWVALEDADEQNGAVRYYEGSHALPEFGPADVGVPPGDEHYVQYEEFIQKAIRDFKLEGKLVRLKKGQALIWSANLIHAGSERHDLYRSRHSQVTHVYFEGCRYWTPLYSKGTDIYWRNPAFIPKDLSQRINLGGVFALPQSEYGKARR